MIKEAGYFISQPTDFTLKGGSTWGSTVTGMGAFMFEILGMVSVSDESDGMFRMAFFFTGDSWI